MPLRDLSVWSTVLQMATTESNHPISAFIDPAQAIQQMSLQNAQGDNIQVVTNDEKVYWLVSSTLAAKLYSLNFYPLPGNESIQE